MYLKNFANKNGMLWKRNLRYGTCKQATPAQIGYKDFLYETQWKNPPGAGRRFLLPNFLEHYFSSREAIYNQCILSICRKLSFDNCRVSDISIDERRILAEFMSNILLRHPIMISLMKYDEGSQNDIYGFSIDELNMWFGSETESVRAFIEKCKWLIPRWPDGYFQAVQGQLENMCLTFFASKNAEFITCDWPVIWVRYEENILCLLLPLTPKYCICYNHFFPKENITVIPDDMVRRYNRLHIEKKFSSISYLFAHNREELELLFEKGGDAE